MGKVYTYGEIIFYEAVLFIYSIDRTTNKWNIRFQ